MPEQSNSSVAREDSAAQPAASAASASAAQRILRYRLFWIFALVTFAADQLTKYWIVKRLPFGTYGEGSGALTVIPGFWNIVHVGNTGAAWSMFAGRSITLATLAGATLVAIFVWRRALGLQDRTAQIAFGLLCGGIVGNLLDRLVHQHVIDFIDLHFGSYTYPTFNVADSGICIGVVLYLWQSLRTPDEKSARTTKA
jgi:signal peptidase II